jgi:hypothetical protein
MASQTRTISGGCRHWVLRPSETRGSEYSFAIRLSKSERCALWLFDFLPSPERHVEILHVPHGTRDYEPILSPNERKFRCLWSNRAIEQADDNHWRVYQ